MNLEIKIIIEMGSDNLYTLNANIGGKEVILECISEKELDGLSIGELRRLAEFDI